MGNKRKREIVVNKYKMACDPHVQASIEMYMFNDQARECVYEHIIGESMHDELFDNNPTERAEFIKAIKEFQVQVEWAFDMKYKVNTLKRILVKMYKALNDKKMGAMKFVIFVKSMEKAYKNELLLADLMH